MSDAPVNVIVVEDHDVMRSYLVAFVEKVDRCKVVAEAADGIQALDKIRKIPADLVVLDLSLPGLSGLSVIRESKKISPVKILVVTLFTDPELINQALQAGADGFCLKDRGLAVLSKAILETLDGKRPVYTE